MSIPPFKTWLETVAAHRAKQAAKAAGKPYKIPRRTKKRASQERIYNARVKVWLTEPANKWCTVFLARRGLTWHQVDETGMVGWEECRWGTTPIRKTARVPRATEVHHRAGRIGLKLLDERDFVPVSRDGHLFIHANPKEARILGLMR